MAEQKIFGIGLSKTGTTTLCEALNILGYRAGTYPALAEKALEKWFQGDFSVDYLSDLDAVTDLPIGAFFRQLDLRYPGSKFILTVRDKAEWLESCKRFFDPGRMIPDEAGLFLQRTQLAAYGSICFNAVRFSYVFDIHNNGVREYFSKRPGDCLVMNILEGEGWETLCKFLNKPIPNLDFPHILPLGEKMINRRPLPYHSR